MSQAGQAWLIVDDSDPRLQYSSEWKQTSGSEVQSGTGNDTLDSIDNSRFGKIWNDTAHRALSSGANMTFGFNGTAYAVYGSYLFPGFLSSAKGRVSCFIDGNPTNDDFTEWPKQIPLHQINGNVVFTCGNSTLATSDATLMSSGFEHELVISVERMTDSIFYLDYVAIDTVLPVSGSTITGEGGGVAEDGANEVVMMIGNPLGTLFDESAQDNGVVEFSQGWSVDEEFFSVITRTPGASVTVLFNGTSIQLFGDLGISSNLSNTAIYQLDDGEPQSIPLLPPSDGFKFFLNQQFFNLSGLSPMDQHTLVVSHNGTAGGMALSLAFFLVQGVQLESPATESTSPSLGHDGGKHALNSVAIGGIVGGSIFLLFLAFSAIGAWLWLRNRRRRVETGKLHLITTNITPFVCEGESAGSASDFDPYSGYNVETQTQTQIISPSDTIAPNLHKRSAWGLIRGPRSQTQTVGASSPTDTRRSPADDDTVDQLRWGNLKLQQRIAVLLGRHHDGELEPEFEIVERRRPQLQVVVHADSGWRMPLPEQERRTGTSEEEEIQEVPPTYTER